MSVARKELQDALSCYITDTLICIDTIREFCVKISKWVLRRETELNMMVDIKQRMDNTDLSFSHVTQSEDKGTAFLEYMKSKVTNMTADKRYAELEKELAAVLKDTLRGLEELDYFLDAVEKLAATSLHVFSENQVLHLPEGLSLEHVQVVISAARIICPLLLKFKREAKAFFFPKLKNVEVLSYQLDRYIQTTQKICKRFEKSSNKGFYLKMTVDTMVELDVDLSKGDIERMLDHINQLDEIRMNQNFRMVFLFQDEPCDNFIDKFSEQRPRMQQFLNELEESAVQLDRMNKGAKISSVAGSSVGAVGGVLSIIGLALMPVTAGASLALTLTGVGLGVTSGVNSAVTTATEIGVNRTHHKKASEVFQRFMEDVGSLQDCLEEVASDTDVIVGEVVDGVVGVTKVLTNVAAVGRGIDSLVDAGSAAAALLKSEDVVVGVGKVVAEEGKALRNVPRVAADIPDVGQAVVKGPLALSKSARAGFIALNALFLGMDVFFICKDSISLSKGSETPFSQFIRARAALWSSEMDSWQKIHDSLCEGLQTSEKKKVVLETPFYPEDVKQLQIEVEKEFLPEDMDEKNEKLEKQKSCVIQ